VDLDRDRLRARLNDISRSLSRLEALRSMRCEDFLADEDSQDIARSRLLTAIEAALNICYHVVARRMHRVPEEYAQCFHLLREAGLIPSELAERLATMARFRNRLVHLYWDIDYGQVYEIRQKSLTDLEAFSEAVANWI